MVVWGALDETQHAHSKQTRIIVIQSDCEEFFPLLFLCDLTSSFSGMVRRMSPASAERSQKLFRTFSSSSSPSSWRKEITYTKIIIIILNQYYRHSKWKWIARNPHLILYFHFSFNMYSDSFTNFQNVHMYVSIENEKNKIKSLDNRRRTNTVVWKGNMYHIYRRKSQQNILHSFHVHDFAVCEYTFSRKFYYSCDCWMKVMCTIYIFFCRFNFFVRSVEFNSTFECVC